MFSNSFFLAHLHRDGRKVHQQVQHIEALAYDSARRRLCKGLREARWRTLIALAHDGQGDILNTQSEVTRTEAQSSARPVVYPHMRTNT